MEMSKQ